MIPCSLGRFESLRDLPRDRQRLVHGHRPVREAIGQRWTLDQLQHERLHAVRFFKAVNCGDVRVIERRQNLRLAFEPREPVEIVGEEFGEDLQRDVAIELRVTRAIHLAHPTGTKGGKDFVRAESSTEDESQKAAAADYTFMEAAVARALVGDVNGALAELQRAHDAGWRD